MMTRARRVYCSWSLRLSCELAEARFWNSPICHGALILTDTLHLVYVLVLNALLCTVFEVTTLPALPAHERVLTVAYMAMACCQLLWITTKPRHYNMYRHNVVLANRLLRLVSLAQSCVTMNPAAIDRMAAAIPGMAAGASSQSYAGGSCSSNTSMRLSPGREAAASAELLAAAAAGQQQQQLICPAASSSQATWLPLLRIVLGPAVVYFGHAHWILPFRWVLPLQLTTCGLALMTAHLRACWIAGSVVVQPLAVPACEAVSNIMSVAVTAVSLLGLGALDELGGPCRGPVNSSATLISFSYVVLLLLLPCYAVYRMEWSLKSKFVRSQGMEMVGPMFSSLPLLLQLVLGVAVLSFVWLMCEIVVFELHLACDVEG